MVETDQLEQEKSGNKQSAKLVTLKEIIKRNWGDLDSKHQVKKTWFGYPTFPYNLAKPGRHYHITALTYILYTATTRHHTYNPAAIHVLS